MVILSLKMKTVDSSKRLGILPDRTVPQRDMNFPYVLRNICIIILGCEILLRVISANMSSNYGPTHYNTTWWDSGSTPTVMGGATSHRLHPSKSCGPAMTETAEEWTSTEHLCVPLIVEDFVCKWWQCWRKPRFDDYIEEISWKLVKIIYIFGLLYKLLFALCTCSLRSHIHIQISELSVWGSKPRRDKEFVLFVILST
jgi:hypothetical protein